MSIATLIWLNFIILLSGTGYAWYNWILVLQGKCKTCSVGVHEKPYTSKCFVGAIFFTVALLVNIWMLFAL